MIYETLLRICVYHMLNKIHNLIGKYTMEYLQIKAMLESGDSKGALDFVNQKLNNAFNTKSKILSMTFLMAPQWSAMR